MSHAMSQAMSQAMSHAMSRPRTLAAVLACCAWPLAVSALDTNVSTPVQVLSRDQLALPGQSIEDVLKTIGSTPGVRRDPALPAGRQDLRGLGQASTLVLIDGQRMPRDALATLPMALIDRVEVMREGMSSIYGSDTISGVINLVTSRGDSFGGLNLAADWLTDCDATAGLARPLWTYNGGLPFGGTLLKDSTWFVPEPTAGLDTTDDSDWLKWGASLGWESKYRPMVSIDPKPDETAALAIGPQSSTPPVATTVKTAFEKELYRSGIPPESTVMRSAACPAATKTELSSVYRDRDQALADWVYYSDYASRKFRAPQDRAADQAKADEARQARDDANDAIRKLLDGCTEPVESPPATAVTATAPPTAPPEELKFQVETPVNVGSATADRKRVPGAALTLTPRLSLDLPGTDINKDADLYSDYGPARGFSDSNGSLTIKLTQEYLRRTIVAANVNTDTASRSGSVVIPTTKLNQEYLESVRGRANVNTDSASRSGSVEIPTTKMTPTWIQSVGGGANVDTDTAFRWGRDPLLVQLDQVDSRVVELGGKRTNVRHGNGDGRWTDPRDRFGLIDGKVADDIAPYFDDAFNIGSRTYLVFNYPQGLLKQSQFDRIRGATGNYNDYCAAEALPASPNDPAWKVTTAGGGKGSWGQPFDDQWALKRVGLTDGADSAWAAVPDGAKPIVVGIIDTGLDWHHLDLDWQNLWRNTREIPGNGLDDDNNGYVDDVIGWDFTNDNNHPWDHDGHGTFVTGIVAAQRNNGAGISGIDPNVRIMVLKALNGFGRTRASYLAKAIAYGVDNGANILNISVAGKGLPPVVLDAIAYAEAKGVLVVVAAGNDNMDIGDVQPAGAPGALVVAATDLDDRRAGFSNWGAGVGVAAPGVEIMSLRARLTDFMFNDPADKDYKPGDNFVGTDRRYYHSTGTSFAAPIVTGIASLVWSKDPGLAAADVRRIIEQSARDLDAPGRDQFTGYGLVDARAALAADPRFFIAVALDQVEPVQQGRQTVLAVYGTADADQFARAWLELGQGENPASFKRVGEEIRTPVVDGTVGEIPVQELAGAKTWTLRLVTEHRNGRTREVRFVVNLG